MFLCQTVPQPPADADLRALNDSAKANAHTVRERLELHRTEPLCAACHTQTDPQGLALEQFDGIGQLRFKENGALIDVSVEFAGKPVSGAQGLGRALYEDPRVPACLVDRVWAYGRGRALEAHEDRERRRADRDHLAGLTRAFAESGYKVPELMSRIALDDHFFTVNPDPSAPIQAD
ncbi:DUF1588 domain-containing protein [bacterium]|nr:DUF1588 domain-containing protein [bacterium]